MWNLLYVVLFAAAGLPADVRPVSGPSMQGSLVEVSPDAITLQTGDKRHRFEFSSLWEIGFQAQPADNDRLPAVWVELVDGSVIHAAQVTVSSDMATVQLTDGAVLEVKTRSIHSIRFRVYTSAPQLATQSKLAELTCEGCRRKCSTSSPSIVIGRSGDSPPTLG